MHVSDLKPLEGEGHGRQHIPLPVRARLERFTLLLRAWCLGCGGWNVDGVALVEAS
jgi:hypothetical protein